jgi:hypothetical protein
MNITLRSAKSNKHNLKIKMSGYGHWLLSMTYRKKTIYCTTTDSEAIDDYNCDEFEKKDRRFRLLSGYSILVHELILKNSN